LRGTTLKSNFAKKPPLYHRSARTESTEPEPVSPLDGHTGLAILLCHFYADVRQHSLLRRVFNQRIGDWLAHLATIREFWAQVTGGPSRYAGQMPGPHFT